MQLQDVTTYDDVAEYLPEYSRDIMSVLMECTPVWLKKAKMGQCYLLLGNQTVQYVYYARQNRRYDIMYEFYVHQFSLKCDNWNYSDKIRERYMGQIVSGTSLLNDHTLLSGIWFKLPKYLQAVCPDCNYTVERCSYCASKNIIQRWNDKINKWIYEQWGLKEMAKKYLVPEDIVTEIRAYMAVR